MNNVQLSFAEGIKIQVPDSLHLITPYVLLEQQDWFEDEISFVRRVLSAGGKAIDIGANFGVYTLSMAQCVGPKGSVWAYEPASSTADALSASVALNGFSQVSVERCAVSSAPGKAQLQLQDNAELNALVRDATSVGRTETVPLVTLDDEMNATTGRAWTSSRSMPKAKSSASSRELTASWPSSPLWCSSRSEMTPL